MKALKVPWIMAIALAALVFLGGCDLLQPLPPLPTVNQSLLFTQAAETLIAQLTQAAVVSTATAVAAPPSVTLPAPSETPQPSPTSQPTPTLLPTPIPTTFATPTLVQAVTATAAVTSPPALPCLAARFIRDVTVPDGTRFNRGDEFTKTWQLENTGSCTWDEDFSAVFVDGDQMSGEDSVPMDEEVLPGERVSISVDLVAPQNPGEYRGEWMLEDSNGERFGLGRNAKSVFWVEIRVKEVEEGTAYSFVEAYCQADWESSAGELPCPGEEGDSDGFVLLLENPEQENRNENEPALWTYPAMERDGWIQGTFPGVKIKDGDHFLADVGCLAGYTKCDIVFEVKYKIGDKKAQSLGKWHEEYDGEITRIDIDLSELDGETVKFILIVDASGQNRDDAAFWLQPQIAR